MSAFDPRRTSALRAYPSLAREAGETARALCIQSAAEICGFLKPPAERQEATARCANRRLPVSFKALIRRGSPLGGHARQQ